MDRSTNLAKILSLLSHNLSYNLLVLATEQLFVLAANDPARNFAIIVEFYKNLIYTDAESTRTILPKIIIPKIIQFYTQHKEAINDLILDHRKRRQRSDQDITVDEPETKTKKRTKKGQAKSESNEEEVKSQTSEQDESQLFDHLTHDLEEDSSLLQIEDIDLNFLIFN